MIDRSRLRDPGAARAARGRERMDDRRVHGRKGEREEEREREEKQ
jgi:hypothetical protein